VNVCVYVCMYVYTYVEVKFIHAATQDTVSVFVKVDAQRFGLNARKHTRYSYTMCIILYARRAAIFAENTAVHLYSSVGIHETRKGYAVRP
jgi:hypothetical protein